MGAYGWRRVNKTRYRRVDGGRDCVGEPRFECQTERTRNFEHRTVTPTRHTPRMRGIQYAAAYRFNHWRLWNIGSCAGACHRARRRRDPVADDDGWCVQDARPRSRGAMRPRFAKNLRPENRGRAECRVHDAPAAPCAKMVVRMHTSIHSGRTEIIRHPARNGLRLIRDLPGDRLVDTVIGGVASAHLTPAPRRQDHTTSPSASGVLVSNTVRVHRSPPER
jgi:hypothetical protein